MTKKARVYIEDGTVLEIYPDDCINWLHKDLYNSLLDVGDDIQSGDRIDITTGLKTHDRFVDPALSQPVNIKFDSQGQPIPESSEDTPE